MKLSGGAQSEIVFKQVIVRAFTACKSDVLGLPGAEQKVRRLT